MAVVVLGGAFHFVGYGPWTLLCMVGGALLIIIDRVLRKEPEQPPVT